ncbi:MAG TPA: hypothetical protein GX517_09245 [Alicyclobacillus sp.]|nr:hypothetical protein [Alicyclobacillus sp.]
MAYYMEFDAGTGICLALHETEGEVHRVQEGSLIKEIEAEMADSILNDDLPLWLYKLEPTGEIKQITPDEYFQIVAPEK